MGNILIAPDVQRANFDRCVEVLTQYLSKKDNTVYTVEEIAARYQIVPHVLTARQDLKDAATQYQFDYRVGASQDKPLEQRLNRNELFFATGFGVHIQKFDASGDNIGNYLPYPYADAAAFNGAGEAKALNALFNGVLSAKTQNTSILPGLLLNMASYVPESQVVTGTPAQARGWGGSDEARGFRSLTPNFIIDGDEDTKFQIDLAPGVYTNISGTTFGTGNNGTLNACLLRLVGFKVSAYGGNGASKAVCF